MSKPTISEILHANKTLATSFGSSPVAVFVGATSGIGQHTAFKLAEYTESPTIYIVGRSEKAGKYTLDQLRSLNSNPAAKYYFLKHDFTLIKEADSLASELKKLDRLNLLFLSPGYLTLSGRQESSEGIDCKMAVNYYARWRLVDNLMPLLAHTADDLKQPARVVSVLQPGNEGKFNEEDMGLKNHFTLTACNRHIVEFTSLAVLRFARLYPNVSFTHAHPGFVKTGIMRELPWWVKMANPLINCFATDVTTSSEKFIYLSTDPRFAKGAYILDKDLGSIKEKSLSTGYLTEKYQEMVWNHSNELFDAAVAK
ncbi:hypothetical protein NADFUDRAFT_46162 [Nadsonia fulvescens var. elongata DSM 6958]|uniref:NAD(P)-binding protein n=1 Tax=Nadsonia fulvescens var. elongata DSM 6958 TaxID=857566 RepID=A0A1E3PNA1_9ASCO|nr:hypothetical protein NADFUDRAFT_46162 [Nadsonia fulvescens var. elongata DSM 6958]